MKVPGAHGSLRRRSSATLVGLTFGLCSAWALAQEASEDQQEDGSASVEGEATLSAGASDPMLAADADADATSSEESREPVPPPVEAYPYAGARAEPGRYDRVSRTSEKPYLKRYLPERNLFEAGLFTGILFPSSSHNLKVPQLDYTEYKTAAFQLGGRFAYFPLRFAGAEIEAYGAGGATKAEGYSAMFYAVRAHVIAQLPLASVVPFVLIGGGTMGAISEEMGHDRDPAFHFGAGVKAPVGRVVALRLDVRDTMTQKVDAKNGRQTHHPEIHLGVSFVFDRSEDFAPLPPDTDYDGLFDNEDKCPTVGALTVDGCPVDSDGDTVVDTEDECPAVPGELSSGCPNRDEDGDGVPIPADQCPDEPGEPPTGCPDRDEDGDGFIGEQDKCPKKPETRNGFEDDDGCPDEMPEAMKRFTGVIAGINFKQGTAEIEPASLPTLDSAIEILQQYPSVRLEVSGHTSSEGTDERNQELSEERANSVKSYFVEKGVDESRIVARGAGPSEPIADNSTKAGRQQNRRIEFRILSQP